MVLGFFLKPNGEVSWIVDSLWLSREVSENSEGEINVLNTSRYNLLQI